MHNNKQFPTNIVIIIIKDNRFIMISLKMHDCMFAIMHK